MINFIGFSGLIVWVLLLSLLMVFCMVVKLIMVGILVKFCRIIFVGMKEILCCVWFLVFYLVICFILLFEINFLFL